MTEKTYRVYWQAPNLKFSPRLEKVIPPQRTEEAAQRIANRLNWETKEVSGKYIVKSD